jgi:hypothetical protein
LAEIAAEQVVAAVAAFRHMESLSVVTAAASRPSTTRPGSTWRPGEGHPFKRGMMEG